MILRQTKVGALLAPLTLLAVGCHADPSESTAATKDALYKSPVPSTTTSYNGVGRVRVFGNGTCSDGTPNCRECTAILIHQDYILTTVRCGVSLNGNPLANPGSTDVVYFSTQSSPIPLGRTAWLPVNEFPSSAGPMMNTDLIIARLSSPPSPAPTPISLRYELPSASTSLTAVGYGKYGTSGCTSAADRNKRSMAMLLNANPYPVCNGDWGGPLLDSSNRATALLSSTTRVTHLPWLHERIYDEMLRLAGGSVLYDGGVSMAGVYRSGSDLPGMPITVASAQACQHSCYSSNSCKAWTFNTSSGSCRLKGDVSPWTADAGHISGVRPIFEFGTSRTRTASEIASYSQETGPAGCARRCVQNAQCQSFTHLTDGSDRGNLFGVCTLYSDQPTTVFPRPSGNQFFFSGLRPGVPSSAKTRSGTAYTTSTRSDARACAAACAQDYRCQSYKYTSPTCSLMDAVGTPSSAASTSYASAQRSVMFPGMGFEGDGVIDGKYRYVPNPPMPEQCRADCENNASCVAFVVDPPTATGPISCTLRSNFNREFELSYWDSGIKGASMF